MSDDRPLIPQPHGGALRPGKPSVNRGGFKRTKREALQLLQDGTPDAARRLVELTLSKDDRVAVVAITQLMDRTIGKASETPQGDAEESAQIDLSVLPPHRLREMSEALAVVRAIRAEAAALASRVPGKVIDIDG